MFELVLMNFVCMIVSYFHNIRMFYAVSLLMLMTWHYKCLINCRQHAHIEINLRMRASRAASEDFFSLAFLHSKPVISFIILLVLQYFVGIIWHSTVKYWGGGGGWMIIQAIPPPKILGGYISPHPPGSTPMLVDYLQTGVYVCWMDPLFW